MERDVYQFTFSLTAAISPESCTELLGWRVSPGKTEIHHEREISPQGWSSFRGVLRSVGGSTGTAGVKAPPSTVTQFSSPSGH
ncbi:hypothetical protein RRG08_045321 [Elysia crispata]|uniref:Uncharacterized protein n=1 Tax=Elysia crispata TaxID=231223 RepID=A0AAE1A320_9GAST|nr:hypothetical protein RRG08_045321 [Elysia crispata]